MKGSGCYELARNWCLLKGLAGNRNATLVNLGPHSLFSDAASARLDRFVEELGDDVRSKFVIKIRWSDFLGKDLGEVPDWFAYCGSRRLIA